MYAKGTTVPVTKTVMEIEKTVMRYGATNFGYASEANRGGVLFDIEGFRIRFAVNYPDVEKFRYINNRRRSDGAVEKFRQAEIKRRWRSLLLRIKSKLESVVYDGVSMEEEFLAQIVLPGNATVYDFVYPQLEVIKVGEMPHLLLGAGRD